MAAVVSLGVATAVFPQQGCTASILTPSFHKSDFLCKMLVCVCTYIHIVAIVLLFSCTNPVLLSPFPLLFTQLKLILLVPNLEIALVRDRFLGFRVDIFPSRKTACSQR